MAYNVIIVEDQGLPRTFFENIVRNSAEYTLAKSFESACGVLDYCKNNPVDLVLMDLSLGSSGDGLTLSEQIKNYDSGIKILVVTQMPEASYLKRAKEIGVDSFWYKDVVELSLLGVMERTVNGEHIYPDKPPVVKIGLSDSSCFTERELDVLRLLTTGISDSEIAEKLNISYDTVRTHIKHMTAKTGLSKVRLAIEARAAGIAIG